MNTPQFHISEFEHLLKRSVSGHDSFYHRSVSTVASIRDILNMDYPEREDDIEFLTDMVNYRMRQSGHKEPKPRFPVSRHLNKLCTEPQFINAYQKRKVYPEVDKPFLFCFSSSLSYIHAYSNFNA